MAHYFAYVFTCGWRFTRRPAHAR